MSLLINTHYCSENERSNYTLPTNTYHPLAGLKDIQVEHNGHEFCVISSDGLEHEVPNYNLSHELRGISVETLQKMLKVGYLTITQSGDNFAINYRGRLLGGGFILAGIAYVGITVVGVGVTLAGAATANPALAAAGGTMITAAPYVAATLLPPPL